MHWIYPSIGGAFFGFGLGSIGDATLTLVIDSYRDVYFFQTREASIDCVTNLFPLTDYWRRFYGDSIPPQRHQYWNSICY